MFLRTFAAVVASAAVGPLVEAQILLAVSTKYSAIQHAHVGTLPPGGYDDARLFQTSDRYTAYVRTKNGSARVMLFDPAKLRAGADEGGLVLEKRVDGEATVDLPEVTAPGGNIFVVLNQNTGPVDVQILVFRRGDRPVVTADAFKRWLQIPMDAVQRFYRVPSILVSVEPCGVATAFSTRSRGDIVVCTELIADLEKQRAGLALHPILLHELAHSLLLLWGLPGYDNEDIADEFAIVLTARASPDAVADLIAWLESQDSLTEAVLQLVNGDRHTISTQRARNMRAALKDPADLEKRWGKLLAPYARLPMTQLRRESPCETFSLADPPLVPPLDCLSDSPLVAGARYGGSLWRARW